MKHPVGYQRSALEKVLNSEGKEGLPLALIRPVPVNLQMEREFEEHPPWDQATAGDEEFEEFEEEGEGGFEEIAARGDHHELTEEGFVYPENEESYNASQNCKLSETSLPCAKSAMGMAGSETKAARNVVKWCSKHPWAYYHNQRTYATCQSAAKQANPGSDECHVWGVMLGLLGLPTADAVPIAAQYVLKSLGWGLLFSC